MLKLIRDFLAMRQNPFRPREEIERIQEEKLRRMLRCAWERSPWHRQRFEAAGITESSLQTLPLSAFPTMDKADLMAHFDEIVTDERLTQQALRDFDANESKDEKLFAGRYHVVHSSGSTGKPNYFVYDEEAWRMMLLGIARGALWGLGLPQIASLLFRKVRILYVAATDGRYGGAMAVGDTISGLRLPQKFLDINRPMAEWLDTLRTYWPQVVIGYPTAIKLLDDIAQENGIPFQPEMMITCGEPLPNVLRDCLKEDTHARIINFYGASESLALGVAGDEDGRLTIFDDLNIVEVIDGEMYLTSLYNLAQPLIRYHLTDRLTLHPTKGGFTQADILLSRSEDILWFKDRDNHKEFLHPLAVEGFCLEGLTDYQFVKHDQSSFTMRAVAETGHQKDICRAMMRDMRELLRKKHLEWVEFHIQFVSQILPDARTGKKKLVLCEQSEQAVS